MMNFNDRAKAIAEPFRIPPPEHRDTILLVDDEIEMLESMAAILGIHKLDVLTARDGAEAVRILDSVTPELVVTDIKMPEFNGIDFMETLREDNAGLPIVVLSGVADPEVIINSFKLGATDFVLKPVINHSKFAGHLKEIIAASKVSKRPSMFRIISESSISLKLCGEPPSPQLQQIAAFAAEAMSGEHHRTTIVTALYGVLKLACVEGGYPITIEISTRRNAVTAMISAQSAWKPENESAQESTGLFIARTLLGATWSVDGVALTMRTTL